MIMNHHAKHDITEDSARVLKGLQTQATIQFAMQHASETDYAHHGINLSLNPAEFEILFVRWIARCSIPFRIVECEEFRAMITYFNKTCDEWLPTSDTTIKE